MLRKSVVLFVYECLVKLKIKSLSDKFYKDINGIKNYFDTNQISLISEISIHVIHLKI